MTKSTYVAVTNGVHLEEGTTNRPKERRQYRPISTRPWITLSFSAMIAAIVAVTAIVIAGDRGGSDSTQSYEEHLCDGCAGAPNPALQLALSLDFTAGRYFAVVYLPKIVAVILQSCWSITYAATKAIQPFYRLVSQQGYAPGQSSWTRLTSRSSFKSSIEWIFILTGLVYAGLGLIVTLVSEAFKVEATGSCETDSSSDQPCAPQLVINRPLSLILVTLLALVGVTILMISLLNRCLVSGTATDPTSVLAIADMLQDKNVVRDLQRIRPNAGAKEIKRALHDSVWRLGSFRSTSGDERCGICKDMYQPTVMSSREPWTHQSTPSSYSKVLQDSNASRHLIDDTRSHDPNFVFRSPLAPISTSPSPPPPSSKPSFFNMHTLEPVILLTLITTLFALILTYRLIPGQSQDPLNTFMNSADFGPRFLLSSLALLTTILMKRADPRSRTLDLLSRMLESPQRALDSVAVGVSSSPWTSFADAIRRRRWFVVSVSLTALLGEVLMVVVSGVPFAQAQTAAAYQVCTFVSLVVLALMACVTVCLIYKDMTRKNTKILTALSSVMNSLEGRAYFLCGSNLVRPSGSGDRSEGGGQAGEDMYVLENVPDDCGVGRWTVNRVHGRDSGCSK